MLVNVDSTAIPLQERGYGQPVTKIVEARASAIAALAEADLA